MYRHIRRTREIVRIPCSSMHMIETNVLSMQRWILCPHTNPPATVRPLNNQLEIRDESNSETTSQVDTMLEHRVMYLRPD